MLIFDFDGTLADTSLLHSRAFAETLSPWGLEVDYTCIAGRRTEDALRLCFEKRGITVPDSDVIAALTSEKQRRVRRMIAAELVALPSVDVFLQWAKTRYRMALVTAGSRGTIEIALRKLGYRDLFDPVVCAEDVEKAKPHPEGFLRALELTSVPAEEALVFEDSEAGIMSARLAGIDCLTEDFLKCAN